MALFLGILLGFSIAGAIFTQMRVWDIEKEEKERQESETPPPIPKEATTTHTGGYHSITSYDNCGIVEVETYHYASNGCRSGFNLDMKFELPYTNAKIELLEAQSHHKKLRIFNPENPKENVYLIGKWVCLKCGCYTWKWKVIGSNNQYIMLLDKEN